MLMITESLPGPPVMLSPAFSVAWLPTHTSSRIEPTKLSTPVVSASGTEAMVSETVAELVPPWPSLAV